MVVEVDDRACRLSREKILLCGECEVETVRLFKLYGFSDDRVMFHTWCKVCGHYEILIYKMELFSLMSGGHRDIDDETYRGE